MCARRKSAVPSSNASFFDIYGPAPGSPPEFGVSDFVAAINQTLQAAYPEVIVEGEVSGFKINQGKFVFFDLKDEQSFVGCFMMAFKLKVPLEDGMMVKVRAAPKLTAKGRFSLTVKDIRLSGEGTLKRAFEILKAKLEREGLFDPARKRPLPEFPQKVAVIASVDSAGFKDFKKIANERWGGVEFDLLHVQVQGEAAPGQIVRAISYANALKSPPDALVLIRGGGSLEDLMAFNDEQVARAVAASRVPTLVGVGHEVDVTLAGLAADARASTPTNAAQMLLPDKTEVLYRLAQHLNFLDSAMYRLLTGRRRDLALRMGRSLDELLARAESKLEFLKRALAAYGPGQVLRRGYAIARVGGKAVKSGRQIKAGDSFVVELSDANIDSEAKNVRFKTK